MNTTYTLTSNACLFHADMREALAALPECCIDAVVTDPPYHLTSIVKRFGAENSAPAQFGSDGRFSRASRGFMGKQWDGGNIAFQSETWREVFRVLKPGGHLVAMGGTRTYHRLACAIEDAGFEIRDAVQWLYGTGFPKSHNVGDGWGTALKPACEIIALARKPLSEPTVAANVLRWGTGAINIDGCRVPSNGDVKPRGSSKLDTDMNEGWARPWMENRELVQSRHDAAIDRANTLGRWPANVVHDGSVEVVEAFPTTQSGIKRGGKYQREGGTWQENCEGGMFANGNDGVACYADSGSAARFFYSAKANAVDRAGSKHPTVKPVTLMRWLVRLVTPVGGIVLDPFAGTGTTGQAAVAEGCKCILVEREDEYVNDVVKRFAQ